MERREALLKESPDPSRRKRLQGIDEEEEAEKKPSIFEHPDVKPIIEALKQIPRFTLLGLNCLREHPKYRDAWRRGFPLAVLIVLTFTTLAIRNFTVARRFIALPMSVALISLAYLSGIGIYVTYFTLIQAYLALKGEKVKRKLQEEGISYEELLEERIKKGFVVRYYGFLVIAGAILGVVSLLRHFLPPIFPVIPGFLHGSLRTAYIVTLISIRLLAAGVFLLFVYVVPAILGQVRPFAYRETLKERLGIKVTERKRGISKRWKKVRKRYFELLQEEIKDLKTSLIMARFRMAIDYLPYLGISAILFPPSTFAANRIRRRIMYDPYPLDDYERGLLVFVPVSIFVILILTTPIAARRIFLSPTFNLAYGLGILRGVRLFEEVIASVKREEDEGGSRAYFHLNDPSTSNAYPCRKTLGVSWNTGLGIR